MKLTDNSPFKMNSVLMLNKQSLSSKNIKLKKLNPDLPSVKYLFKKKRESIPKLRLYNKTDTNSITSQQLFKLTQSSMNENSNSTALDTFNEPSSALSYRKIDMYNNKARLIKKKIYLDTSLFNSPYKDRTVRTHIRQSSNILGNPLPTSLTKANKTVSIIEYSNVTYKKIKDRCLDIKESSENKKKDMMNFPSDSDDVVMSIKRKLMDTDDNEYKRRVMQEKDNEIYNDVIEDKDKGNKQYNEQQLESMRTSTK